MYAGTDKGNDDYFISQRLDATGMLNFREKRWKERLLFDHYLLTLPEPGTEIERNKREPKIGCGGVSCVIRLISQPTTGPAVCGVYIV